jgi:hypothetical protein
MPRPLVDPTEPRPLVDPIPEPLTDPTPEPEEDSAVVETVGTLSGR